jgi:hypothetical protein
MDELAKSLGFESEKEMFQLVCRIDLSSPIKVARFQQWKNEDGTKFGLLKAIEENRKE